MTRLVSVTSRAGLSVCVFLIVAAFLRWGPVHAEPPWDVRMLHVAPMAVALAVAAALSGPGKSRWPWRPVVAALLLGLLGLVAVMTVRPRGGLPVTARDAWGRSRVLAAGPLDVTGDDLADGPPSRRVTLLWDGPLRVPRTGSYRLWAHGRGRVEIQIDGADVLRAEGARLEAGASRTLAKGTHRLLVRYAHRGPGLRLRVGWTLPARGGAPGSWSDLISPRYLGQPSSAVWWRLTDVLALVVAGLAGVLVFLLPWSRRRRLPLPTPITRVEVVASIVASSALGALLTWPMAAHPSSLGVVDRVDGRLNAWILAWNAHALLGDPAHVFGAPIFHPLPDALAFTENLLLPSLVVAPATLLGGPVLGYNLAFLASAVASGLGVQWLVRRITGAPLGAFVAGAAFAWGGQRLVRMAHLHAELTLFLPFLLVALDLFWEERTWRRAALIGLLVALQGWSSIYMGAIAATVVAVTLACMAVGGLGRGGFLRLACACLLAATLLAPVAVPYLRMRAFQGVEFTLADQVLHATTLESYAAPPGRLLGPLVKRHMDGTRIREALFPGLTLLVLGLAGLASAPRRWRLVALAAAACAILVSLGPETRAYRFVYEEVVFFRGLRALGRFAVVPVLVLSALAGLALAGARKRAVALALGLVVIEAWNRPLHYGVYEPPGPASRWLSGREGAVASLPLGEDDTRAMLRGIAHFRPLLNGDSGFVPRSYARVRELLAPPRPSSDGLRFLRAVGVSEIQARGDPGLPLLARFGGEAIYAVTPGPAAGPPRPGDPAVVVWEGKRAMVDLGTARVVGRVAFEVGDAPWIERPRLLLSEDGEGWERVVGSASLADATLSLTRRPTAGLGEIVFRSRRLRLVRLDPELPLRRGIVWVAP